MTIELYINSAGNIPLLKKIEARTKNLKPALSEIGNMIKEDSRLNFVEAKSPYGKKWQALSPATYNKKGRGGVSAKPLRDTGRLMSSITFGKVTRMSVTVGTNVIYAAVHNFKEGNIPQRQFLPTDGLNREQQREVRSILEEYLLNG